MDFEHGDFVVVVDQDGRCHRFPREAAPPSISGKVALLQSDQRGPCAQDPACSGERVTVAVLEFGFEQWCVPVDDLEPYVRAERTTQEDDREPSQGT